MTNSSSCAGATMSSPNSRGAQRPVAQRHRHRLALALAEDQAVAAGELRRRLGRALELVDHLALGDVDARRATRQSRAPARRARPRPRRCGSRRRRDGCGRSRAASNSRAPAGNPRRRAPAPAGAGRASSGNSSGSRVRSPASWSCGMSPSGSIRPSSARMSETRGMRPRLGARAARLGDIGAPSASDGIEQAVGVVEGRAEQLAARQILVGRRDAALDQHRAGVDRPRIAEARQRRAIGAHQEDRLDQVAARLHDGERGELAVVERALGHDAVDARAPSCSTIWSSRSAGTRAVAAAAVGEQPVGIGDGGFAALDGDIHVRPPSMMRVVRGRQTMLAGAAEDAGRRRAERARGSRSTARRNRARQRRPARWSSASLMPGPVELQRRAAVRPATCEDQRGRAVGIFLACPARKSSSAAARPRSATKAKCASAGVVGQRRAGVEAQPARSTAGVAARAGSSQTGVS